MFDRKIIIVRVPKNIRKFLKNQREDGLIMMKQTSLILYTKSDRYFNKMFVVNNWINLILNIF